MQYKQVKEGRTLPEDLITIAEGQEAEVKPNQAFMDIPSNVVVRRRTDMRLLEDHEKLRARDQYATEQGWLNAPVSIYGSKAIHFTAVRRPVKVYDLIEPGYRQRQNGEAVDLDDVVAGIQPNRRLGFFEGTLLGRQCDVEDENGSCAITREIVEDGEPYIKILSCEDELQDGDEFIECREGSLKWRFANPERGMLNTCVYRRRIDPKQPKFRPYKPDEFYDVVHALVKRKRTSEVETVTGYCEATNLLTLSTSGFVSPTMLLDAFICVKLGRPMGVAE